VKYSFEDLGEDTVLEDQKSRVLPGEMILEAARRIQEPAIVAAVLGDIDRVIAPAAHPLLRSQKLTLTPTDGFVLSRVDGTLTAAEIFHLTPLPAEDTERSLFALLCTGAVEYRAPAAKPGSPRTGARTEPAPGSGSSRAGAAAGPAPAAAGRPAPPAAAPRASPPPPPSTPLPAPSTPATDPAVAEAKRRADAEARRREIEERHDGIRTKDHFEVLGIARSAGPDEVKEAYFRLARPYHPDAPLDPSLDDLREKRNAVFIRLGEAFETLRNTASRARYEQAYPPRRAPRPPTDPAPSTPAAPPPAPPAPPAPDPQREAAEAAADVRRAEKLMGEEKYWDAIQLLEGAVARLQGPAARQANVLLARAYMKNPKWRHRAEELLGEVVRAAPEAPEPYLALGELYRGAQLRARAAAMYRKVLQLSPRNEEALNALRAIDAEEKPPSGGDGGLMDRFRKKP
jgi:tetratricopeptide (TPR) repeat protein